MCDVSGSTPVAFATVCATPPSPSQRSCLPGLPHVIDADAVRAELLRKRLRNIDERGLCGAVVDSSAIGLEERVHQSDVHNRTARALLAERLAR